MRVRLPAFVSCDVGHKTNMREPPRDDDPQDDDELYTARELEELDELNRLGDDHTSFFQSRWWKRGAIAGAIAFAMLLVLSLLLPILQRAQSGSSGQTEAPVGRPAPDFADFALAAAQGGTVRLSDELNANSAVVLVFYRGFF